MNERERFDSLLEVLDALAEANESTPILVEGKRDVAALRSLGCAGEILVLHNGRQLFVLAEEVSRTTSEVILLTDWDRKGGILLGTMQNGLAANGVRTDLSFRDRIKSWVNSQLKDVESLVPYVRRGLGNFHRTSIEERARGIQALRNLSRH